MATMAAKLRGKAEVVRSLSKERKAIKEAANQHEISLFMILYNEIKTLVTCGYSKAEILKITELCIRGAGKRRTRDEGRGTNPLPLNSLSYEGRGDKESGYLRGGE